VRLDKPGCSNRQRCRGEQDLNLNRAHEPPSFVRANSCKMTFMVKRDLMNPKFDGYKLSPLSESDSVSTISLPSDGISQATVSTNSHLYFQEVQSRVRHNHLAIASASSDSSVPATFAYIDKNRVFTTVVIDQVSPMLSCYYANYSYKVECFIELSGAILSII
jgi:hypothetical protein